MIKPEEYTFYEQPGIVGFGGWGKEPDLDDYGPTSLNVPEMGSHGLYPSVPM